MKLDGTEITGAGHGVCSKEGLEAVKSQAKAVQKARQDAMKSRTQVHNKEFTFESITLMCISEKHVCRRFLD